MQAKLRFLAGLSILALGSAAPGLGAVAQSTGNQLACEVLAVEGEVQAGALVAVTDVELASKAVRKKGESVVQGDIVIKGTVANRGTKVLELRQREGTVLQLAPADTAVVDGDCVMPTGCQVSCGEGLYACCSNFGPWCFCSDADFNPICHSGGPGSTSCGVTLTPIPCDE